VKLFVFDLDGTILDENTRLSPKVESAIRRAVGCGHRVTLASGRGCPPTRLFARKLGLQEPIICYQGAVVESPDGSPLMMKPLPRSMSMEIAQWAREQNLDITMYQDGKVLTRAIRQGMEFYDRWFGLPVEVVDDLAAAAGDRVIKFIITTSPEENDPVRRLAQARFGARVQVVKSHDFFIELVSKGVSKGDALGPCLALYTKFETLPSNPLQNIIFTNEQISKLAFILSP
jgi:HAD superfamily hydrolase (TIGR01484 family)